MDASALDEVLEADGVEKAAPQTFLASLKADCCSVKIQVIGFDPERDFTIQPWIRKSYSKEMETGDIIVGSSLTVPKNKTLTFYGVDCHVAAKLDKTGTSFDTAVFTNQNTIKALIRSSVDRKMNDFQKLDPDKVVSCILINPADGYSVEEVVNDINIHVKKVKAIRTKEMISGISESLSGVSDITAILIAAVWLLGIVILLLAFTMSVNERKREFAVLRVIGSSRGMLASVVLREALTIGAIGGIAGAALALLIVLPFNSLIETQLGLPFLLPAAGTLIALTVAALLIAVLVSALASALSAYRISRLDPAVILRGDQT